MTWKEFKDFVESRDVKDDDEVAFIDVAGAYFSDEEVSIKKTSQGLAIY